MCVQKVYSTQFIFMLKESSRKDYTAKNFVNLLKEMQILNKLSLATPADQGFGL